MSMRDIHFGVRLPFETPEDRDDSEEILHRMLGVVCRLNRQHLRKHPATPPLYSSGVVYSPPDQTTAPATSAGQRRKLMALVREMGVSPESGAMILRIVQGIEVFLDIPSLYARGHGDCNELVPVRVAELWRAGIAARSYLVAQANDRGGITFHAVVQWPDGSSEDPSLILGMGGAASASARAEEIRKNKERWAAHMDAAEYLIKAEGASPKAIAQQIDQMGLLPPDGVFRAV